MRTTIVLAVLGACLVTAAGTFAVVSVLGSGTHPPAGSAPGGRGRQLTAGSPAPVTPSPAHSRRDPLGTAAASYLASRAGTVLTAVYDIATGRTWRLGQGQPQDEGSVVKLDLLETLLAERGADGGSGLSASDRLLAQQMIEVSDNDAATSLWYEVGGAARIRSFNAAAGLADTSPSSCVTCPGFPWPGWGLTTTIPADQLALLKELIRPGPLLTDAERGYALSLMEDVTPSQRWGVCAGVPPHVTVALKNGWLPLDRSRTDWQVNSVGWISGQGRDYLIAVLSTGNPAEQYGIDTIGHLAAIVWNGMR